MKLRKILLIILVSYYPLAILLYLGILKYAIIITMIALPLLLIKNKNINLKKEFKQVNSMNGCEFEHYLKKVFKNLNYKVKHTKLSNDQGADLIIERNNEKTVIQAKRYSKPVGNKAVQEVLAAKAYYDCDKAIVITNNTFTKSAIELANKCNVKLWDNKILKELI